MNKSLKFLEKLKIDERVVEMRSSIVYNIFGSQLIN